MKADNHCALCRASDPTEDTLVKGVKICKKCFGAWVVGAEPIPCDACKGTGEVPCPRCDGSGECTCDQGYEHTCSTCDGRGKTACYECAPISVKRPLRTTIHGARA